MFFKNRNIISKIIRSKVTDYAALNYLFGDSYCTGHRCIIQVHHSMVLGEAFSYSRKPARGGSNLLQGGGNMNLFAVLRDAFC